MPEENIQPTPQPAPQPIPLTNPVTSPVIIQPTNGNIVSPSIPPAPQPVPSVSYTVTDQTMAIANGQSFEPSAPAPFVQFEQTPAKKPTKWRFLFIILGILQIVGIGLFFMIVTSIGGQSGSEFIVLALGLTLIPAIGFVGLVNLIGLPIYMLKRKPHGKGLVFSIISLLISLVLFSFGAFTLYQLRVAAPKQIQQLSRNSEQKFAAQQQQFNADNAKPEITKADAVALLSSCQLKGFYYTMQTSPIADGNWAESSTTGVVLTKIDGKPYRISIADRLITELVPIARQAQKNCAGQPQFYHDGHYE